MSLAKLTVFSLVLLFTVLAVAQADESLKVKSLRVDGNLTFNFLAHRLEPGWKVEPSNLAKIFTQDGVSTEHYSYPTGQSLDLDFAYRPTKRLNLSLGLLFIGNYADRYWLPINDEHRLKDQGKKVKWTRGEIFYNGDRLKAQLFGGIGHYHWQDQGDLFQLYPEQFDLYTYRRVSGRQIPRGLDLKYNSDFGKLELVHGAEVVWGDRASTYGKYNWRWGYFNNSFIFKDAKIRWGQKSGERLRAAELTTSVDILANFPLDLGVLYQPFRSDHRPYTYVVNSGANNIYIIPNSTATINTGNFQIKTGTTSNSDALGYKAKIGCKIIPFIDYTAFGLAYEGLTAGNKQEFSGEAKKELSSYANIGVQGIYRKPLIGPLPYLREGTADNPGPAVTLPRARDAAFWVTMENRQATIYNLTFNFDPTPSSWFYLWQPNILDEWNMNPREDATVALAFQYAARKYTTVTDRWYYYTRDNEILWEGEFDPFTEFWDYRPAGRWPTKWLHNINAMIRINPTSDYKFLLNCRTGQDISTGSLAYTLKTTKNKPIINYFLTTLWLDKKPYKTSFTFGKDVWGPEEWQQRLGGTIDQLYKFSFSRLWKNMPAGGTDSTLGIEYVGTREKDNLYLYPELGPFNEWRLFYTLHFGSVVSFRKVEKKKIVLKEKKLPPPPPQASLTVITPEFTPGLGDNPHAIFELTAIDSKGIKEWELNILDQNENLIQTFRGEGQPPSETEWDGTDLASGQTAPEGNYSVVFSVKNTADLSAQAEAQTVTLKIPQAEMTKEILKEMPVEVTEEARGLVINVKSEVLFDFDKFELKPEAVAFMSEVKKVFDIYPENKIRIEGHSDSIGSSSYNLKLSKKRTQSVYNYFINEGLDKERMQMAGYGESFPIATNRTKAGRAKNRRVEIILLKNDEATP